MTDQIKVGDRIYWPGYGVWEVLSDYGDAFEIQNGMRVRLNKDVISKMGISKTEHTEHSMIVAMSDEELEEAFTECCFNRDYSERASMIVEERKRRGKS